MSDTRKIIWESKEAEGEEWQSVLVTFDPDDCDGSVSITRWSEHVPMDKESAIAMAKAILEAL